MILSCSIALTSSIRQCCVTVLKCIISGDVAFAIDRMISGIITKQYDLTSSCGDDNNGVIACIACSI